MPQTDSQPITLGELLVLLEPRDQAQEIVFDFGYFAPNGLASYRGYYDHLAIAYKEFDYKQQPTLRALADELRAAIGKAYEGYKGGDFRMGPNTPLWVANWGDCPSTAVVGLAECDYKTVIATGYCENWAGGIQRAHNVLAHGLGFGNAHP